MPLQPGWNNGLDQDEDKHCGLVILIFTKSSFRWLQRCNQDSILSKIQYQIKQIKKILTHLIDTPADRDTIYDAPTPQADLIDAPANYGNFYRQPAPCIKLQHPQLAGAESNFCEFKKINK